jgi:hypothetical protein
MFASTASDQEDVHTFGHRGAGVGGHPVISRVGRMSECSGAAGRPEVLGRGSM